MQCFYLFHFSSAVWIMWLIKALIDGFSSFLTVLSGLSSRQYGNMSPAAHNAQGRDNWESRRAAGSKKPNHLLLVSSGLLEYNDVLFALRGLFFRRCVCSVLPLSSLLLVFWEAWSPSSLSGLYTGNHLN